MNETITLNKGVVIWIAAAVVVLVGVGVAAMMFKAGQQDTYVRIDPNSGMTVVKPLGAAHGWEMMPRFGAAPTDAANGQIKRAAPYAGANRGAELMPVPPPGGGTLAK